jgi:hypothetical protein
MKVRFRVAKLALFSIPALHPAGLDISVDEEKVRLALLYVVSQFIEVVGVRACGDVS